MTANVPGRVTLDRPRPGDAAPMTRALQDREVVRWLTSLPWPYRLDDARGFIAQAGAGEFVIRMDGRFAGCLRIADHIGYWLVPALHGRGIARRACVLGLSRWFAAGHDRSRATVLRGNARSERLLRHLGFQGATARVLYSRAMDRRLATTELTLRRADFARLHPIDICTPRLRIGAFHAADLPALHRILTAPETARMLLRFRPGQPMAETAALFTPEALAPPLRLVVRQQDRVIGQIGVGAGQPGSVFYALDPSVWGHGVGHEMLGAFLDEIGLRLDPPALTATVFDDNPASAAMLRAQGFVAEARERIASLGRDGLAWATFYRRTRQLGSARRGSRDLPDGVGGRDHGGDQGAVNRPV